MHIVRVEFVLSCTFVLSKVQKDSNIFNDIVDAKRTRIVLLCLLQYLGCVGRMKLGHGYSCAGTQPAAYTSLWFVVLQLVQHQNMCIVSVSLEWFILVYMFVAFVAVVRLIVIFVLSGHRAMIAFLSRFRSCHRLATHSIDDCFVVILDLVDCCFCMIDQLIVLILFCQFVYILVKVSWLEGPPLVSGRYGWPCPTLVVESDSSYTVRPRGSTEDTWLL